MSTMRARALDVAIRANTGNFEKGMQTISRGLKATIVGMNAVAAASAGQEKSIIGMINAVAIGFATGGPWGAAIAAAGIGIGALIGKTKEAEEQWRKSMEAMAAETKKLESQARETADRLFELRGGSIMGRDLAKELDESKTATAIAELRRHQFEMKPKPKDIFGRAGAYLFDSEAGVESGRAAEIAKEQRKQADLAIANAKDYLAIKIETAEWDTKLLGITDERERKAAEINAELIRAQREFMAIYDQLPEGALPFTREEGLDALAQNAQARLDALPAKLEEVSEAARIAARSVADFLSQVIVQGADAVNVLRSLAQTFLSMAIQRGANAAFGVPQP